MNVIKNIWQNAMEMFNSIKDPMTRAAAMIATLLATLIVLFLVVIPFVEYLVLLGVQAVFLFVQLAALVAGAAIIAHIVLKAMKKKGFFANGELNVRAALDDE